jgi:hypothetical protein
MVPFIPLVTDRSINQSINQLINQSINQSKRSIGQEQEHPQQKEAMPQITNNGPDTKPIHMKCVCCEQKFKRKPLGLNLATPQHCLCPMSLACTANKCHCQLETAHNRVLQWSSCRVAPTLNQGYNTAASLNRV